MKSPDGKKRTKITEDKLEAEIRLDVLAQTRRMIYQFYAMANQYYLEIRKWNDDVPIAHKMEIIARIHDWLDNSRNKMNKKIDFINQNAGSLRGQPSEEAAILLSITDAIRRYLDYGNPIEDLQTFLMSFYEQGENKRKSQENGASFFLRENIYKTLINSYQRSIEFLKSAMAENSLDLWTRNINSIQRIMKEYLTRLNTYLDYFDSIEKNKELRKKIRLTRNELVPFVINDLSDLEISQDTIDKIQDFHDKLKKLGVELGY